MRVLILGHNPFNLELPNGRTLYELFSQFSKDEVAEIFLHDDLPNFDICQNYYKMTDFDVIKSFYSWKTIGKIVKPMENERNNAFQRASTGAYRFGSKRKSYTILLRNIMWKLSRWNSASLDAWIREFEPDVLFYYSSNYYFTIDMAMSISKKYRIPIVTYIVDDFYFNSSLNGGIWGSLNQMIYNKKLRKLLSGQTTICLNGTMKEAYEKEFEGSFYTIYTTSELTPFASRSRGSSIKMSYLGGIACGRGESLIEIGRVIDKYNLPIEFSVFTRETRPWLLVPLSSAVGISVYDGLSYQQVIEQMKNSDILVHVEGFKPEDIRAVQYSMSTKIADILSCNRCLLAYGPSDVASISYLKQNQCGLVATNRSELIELLLKIAGGYDYNEKNVTGIKIAARNHSTAVNDSLLRKILSEAIQKEMQ